MSVDNAIDTALQHHQAGRLAQAEAIYRQVLGQQPKNPDALHLLGMIAHQTGNQDAAIDLISRAIAVSPRSPVFHNNIGNVYRACRRLDEAATSYRKALALKSDFAEACNNLGIVLKEQGQHAEALECYRQAVRHNPEYVEARWSSTLLQIPAIAGSGENINESRARLANELAKLDRWFNSERSMRGWQAVGTHQPFYLAYQEQDNRELLSAYGNLCTRLMKSWQDRQVLAPAAGSGGDVIRIGIVSAHIHDHSVWNAILKGWYRHLDRSRFELHSFHVGPKSDAETRWAQERSDSFQQNAGGIHEWAKAIAGRNLDVLVYPEIGMDPMTVKLAGLRLAPIQVASWGHPETSGLPGIDYFLSAELLEPADAQQHYTEKLVNLPNLGCCYQALPVEPTLPDLGRLGIDPELPLLLCPGTPFKYTPQHDRVFVEIARQLERCQFIFFAHPVTAFTEQLRRRLQKAFRREGMRLEDYAVFIPWLDRASFYGLMQRAEVFLDTIGFSGFNTAMQAIECRLPLVTREGRFMRGRLASGILRRMGLEELIADSDDSYVSLVVRLVQDSDYHGHLVQRIAANQPLLFDDAEPIKQLERFFTTAVNEHSVNT